MRETGEGPAAGRREPAPLRLLFGRLGPHWRTLALGGVLSLLGAAAGLAMPLMAKYVVDALGAERPATGPLAALSAVAVLGAGASAGAAYLMGRTGEDIVLGARRRLVGRVLRLGVPAVDRLTPGDLLTRVTGDTTLLRTALTTSVVESAAGVCTLAGAIAFMAALDGVLLCVTLLVIGVVAGVSALLMPRIQRAQRRAQEAVGEMGSALDRALQAFRTVKASGAEERETGVVAEAAARARDRGVTVAGWTALTGASVLMAVQLAFLSVLAVGGTRVASGALEVSSLIAFLLYLFSLVSPLGQLVEGWAAVQQGLVAVGRVHEIEALPGEPAGTAPTPGTGPVGIRFDDVAFRYGDDRGPAHDGVTFEVPPRGMTALVGPSGAGKSTVFALLERFYDHQSGTIAVDGRDIREWPLAELRASLGYVEQDAPVLAGTLRDNLLFAAPRATPDELRHAVARTGLDELVARLPEGLDTPVGHRGTALSGGERQRVAIARALLRKPRLLLLDEVTSHLDAVSEQRLRDVVLELAAETTVLVIAHRLSTVVRADRIVVMEAGRVRAVGGHEELVGSDDLYRELAATQLAADRSGAP
ncbi:ABC transporter ATP-binding protein [Streptomyces mobaraensis NBRC 13819 = DSM 40847]|uniref:ABC transporter ATPase/permease n=1 Tax=Streptomyces mobaraensis (strain ATCC 29032 / DSM 40847 / JCM 4168 / NBRC 13819 / NCIMB 11159 / IPCR 16-22) TaxID=1223523 RepID=M3A657_STRM1|nr:ABC transporter ATP-binding protein [Streptomyces mobaraensis]EMF00609.1 ABC transporter ATPase/permease [Streptomyces mobaraensis NBRC 13819 = DSM 40847]QTT75904.1 ABC transporter ATP-binding protein [Streptomyces mobaraensis NBRC 13819 = DSM 40847]